ncbi:MAG: fasciclin domain-containing protein [Burkholderiales bacterium]
MLWQALIASKETPMDMNTQEKDIVVNATNAGNFTALANALKAADLVSTYKGMGPFTFFAPTDAAFEKIPRHTLHALLKDKAKLAAVLNFHVVSGAMLAKDMKSSKPASLQGQPLTIAATGSGITVNGLRVSRDEIEASNGVIHPIDTVMMPDAD